MTPEPIEADDFDDDKDLDDEDDAWPFDCGLGSDGQCSKAGSEECDWDCPLSRSEHYAGSTAWNKLHETIPVEGCECCECREAASVLQPPTVTGGGDA